MISIFIGLSADFLIRTYRVQGNLQPRRLCASNVTLLDQWGPKGFYGSLSALNLSTLCIFWQCCFRVSELSEGWTGDLMKRRDLFIGMEGVMIAIAVLVLDIWHPLFGPMGIADPVTLERAPTGEVADGSKVELGSWK